MISPEKIEQIRVLKAEASVYEKQAHAEIKAMRRKVSEATCDI